MKTLTAFMLLFSTIVASAQSVSLNPSWWEFRYSPGLSTRFGPGHPTGIAGGWTVQLPNNGAGLCPATMRWYTNGGATSDCHHLDYSLIDIRTHQGIMSIAGKSALTINIGISGDNPVFDYHTQASYDGSPANCRFMVEKTNDAQLNQEFGRWWSQSFQVDGVFHSEWDLTVGQFVLSVPLNDLTRWSSVYGKRADYDATATAGFNSAKVNIQRVGFTCGGDGNYGHGIYVQSGIAWMTVTGFAIQ